LSTDAYVKGARFAAKNGKIFVDAPYEFRESLKMLTGARWNPDLSCWVYPSSPSIAYRLSEIFQTRPTTANDEFKELVRAGECAVAAAHYRDAEDLSQPPVRKTDLWRHQLVSYHMAMAQDATMLALDMGPQPLDAKVLTPCGFTEMGRIKIGDEVIGRDGKPTRVIDALDNLGEQEVFRVVFKDGTETRCTADHLWTVRTANDKARGYGWRTFPLKHILSLGLMVKGSTKERQNARWFVPTVSAVEYAPLSEKLPVDPWILGVLLGNGCFGTGISLSTGDEWLLKEAIRILGPDYRFSRSPSNTYDWSIAFNGYGNPLTSLLREMGLMSCHSYTKFVPHKYLYASVDKRLSLLQGLVDTDGYVAQSGLVEYLSASEQLAKDVLFLVRSLGGYGVINPKTLNTGPYKGNTYYRVHFRLPNGTPPCKTPYKLENWRPKQMTLDRAIVDVIPDGVEKVRCIKVANEDGLYLTDNFIVTHNCGKSKVAIDVAQNMPASRVLVLCPKSVVSVWPRELDKHAAVCYRTWAIRRDSWSVDRKARHLKHFLEAPEPAFVIVNYDSAWREGMRQVLLKQKWDLVICDESHRIKGPTAKASKFAAQLTRVARKRICLTGTPLPHSPMDAFSQYRFLDPGIYGDSYPKFRAEYAVMGGYLNKQIVKYINPERFNKKFYSIAYRVMADDVLDLPEFVDEPRTMELSGESKRIYRELATEFVARVKDGEVTVNNALVHMLRLQQVTGGCVPTDDGEVVVVGTDKRQLLGEVIEDLPVGEPFVVFGRFHHDLDAIRGECESRGLTCGELSGRRNDLASWQDGHSDVLIIQLQAGGVGVDVTRARVAIYYSLDFNLGNYLQSRARIRRPGQTRSGLWIHLVAEGTIDEKVYKALEKRQQVVEWVLGNPESILEEAA
jgi:hypothetical protein